MVDKYGGSRCRVRGWYKMIIWNWYWRICEEGFLEADKGWVIWRGEVLKVCEKGNFKYSTAEESLWSDQWVIRVEMGVVEGGGRKPGEGERGTAKGGVVSSIWWIEDAGVGVDVVGEAGVEQLVRWVRSGGAHIGGVVKIGVFVLIKNGKEDFTRR